MEIEIREKRRDLLLRARARRALLIAKQEQNPRHRNPVLLARDDLRQGYDRAAAAFYGLWLRGIGRRPHQGLHDQGDQFLPESMK